MTNYEKYKEEIIQLHVSGSRCVDLVQLSSLGNECMMNEGWFCEDCQNAIKQWFNDEVEEI